MSANDREKFSSRLGFILVAAGCAVGIGNVWKFPYLCGQNGGAAFILIYLLCLVLLAFPILVCELAIGRASQKSPARAFDVLEPKGSKWHLVKYMMMGGTYILMGYYTCVCGWMLYYFGKYISGGFSDPSMTAPQIADQFSGMLNSPGILIACTLFIILAGIGVCSFGVQKGVEKITKVMMTCLLCLMAILAVNSMMLPGGMDGVKFFLVPDFSVIVEKGIGNVVFTAMSQAFFTLSIGFGCMAVFGSYLTKHRSLTGEGVMITVLDTIVAIVAGLVIIPACFAYQVPQDAGPSLIFITMPNVFQQMPGGQIWGSVFFLFLLFAAFSTVITVFENIIVYAIELFGWSRKKSAIVNLLVLSVLCLPCILGFNVLSDLQPLGPGSSILDFEDFLVSSNFLPLGALVCLFFCLFKCGWSRKSFIAEADAGDGPYFPRALQLFMYVAPILMIIIYIKGYYDMFSPRGTGYFAAWMIVAVLFLCFIGYLSFSGLFKKQPLKDSSDLACANATDQPLTADAAQTDEASVNAIIDDKIAESPKE